MADVTGIPVWSGGSVIGYGTIRASDGNIELHAPVELTRQERLDIAALRLIDSIKDVDQTEREVTRMLVTWGWFFAQQGGFAEADQTLWRRLQATLDEPEGGDGVPNGGADA